MARSTLVALGALTAIAFALRVVGMDQSLFGDEYFTHAIVTNNGLRGVWDEVYTTSITPPLHYALAWSAVQLGGDSVILVRLPSLVFGTALVPLMFLVGRQVGGERAGLFAAVLTALSPFAIFYSTEARTYELMVFLVALSMLALLRVLEGGGRRWWVAYALSSCGALWAHYTTVFVIAAGALWAIWAHRERLREVAIAQAAIALGYLPWLPGFLEQRGNDEGIAVISAFSPLTLGRVFEFPLRTLIGHPFVGLEEFPGWPGLLLLVALAALALAAIILRPPTIRGPGPWMRSEGGLMLILALATPIGLLLYDAVGPTLFGVRNVSASLPTTVVLAALLLSSLTAVLPARFAAATVAGLAAVLAVGAIESVGEENRRPPYREAARYLDDVAGENPVVEAPLDASLDDRLGRSSLELYFERPHRVYRLGQDDDAAWREARGGGSVYQVLPLSSPDAVAFSRENTPAGQLELRGQKTFPGLLPVTVLRYGRAASSRLRPASTSPSTRAFE